MNLADLRRDYARAELNETSVERDPVQQLQHWLDEAAAAKLLEPGAMTLATASPDGAPSARVVLLKGLDEHGLMFFTDTRSRKGTELAANPQAALCFWWGELERQVRVSGPVQPVSAADSDAYYHSRPEGSRISAWASHQSQVVSSRALLETQWAETAQRFAGGEIPRPPYWGGYRVVPVEYEFWQGRPNRLHDRLRYRRNSTGRWAIERLSP
jgi:pyridoxamine 5'-phosphate oxidase